MKRNILLAAVLLFSLVSCKKEVAQAGGTTGTINIIAASSVPQAVMNTFTSTFSNATETEWQHNSSDSFICQFNEDNQRHEAHFDDKGHESKHSTICLEAPVPLAILNAFRSQFPGDNVYEWKLYNDGTWKAHFMRSSVKWEITFNADAVIIKSEHD
jgi:hypothetical protein